MKEKIKETGVFSSSFVPRSSFLSRSRPESVNKILIVVHKSTSNPGLVGQVLNHQGYTLDLCCPAEGGTLPPTLDDYRGVVVFGGAMSANDDHLPFIRAELDWIARVLTAQKPYLGICLGAQLLARVLGAQVKQHPQGYTEIGYFPVFPGEHSHPSFAKLRYVYHWHQEGFTLPAGAVQLARGETFKHQAFGYGDNTYGLQFHPEMTAEMIDLWTTVAETMLTLPGAQPKSLHLQGYRRYGLEGQYWLESFLAHWLQTAGNVK